MMLLDPWCTTKGLFRSETVAPRKTWKQTTNTAAVQQLWAQDCDAELVTQQHWAWGPERAVGRRPSVRQQDPNTTESCQRGWEHQEGAVHTVDAIHMTHIHALCRQQREAGTLRETSRWVSMADRWAISKSLFSPLTAKADHAGSTAVYCGAQKNWKLLHHS